MADITSQHVMPTLDAETEIILDQALAEIERLNGLMQQDQNVIERLKAESKIITDHTDAALSNLRIHLDALRRSA